MKKKVKKKEKESKYKYTKFFPNDDCGSCKGREEIKDKYIGGLFTSWHWTYKKCLDCNGTGKNIWHCLSCGGLLDDIFFNFCCLNRNCKNFNLIVKLGIKKDE